MERTRSVLFSPYKIGPMTVPNRFICSPCSLGCADKEGIPSPHELNHIVNLAKGRTGLIIPGFMYPIKTGRVFFGQTGFANNEHAEAWSQVVRDVHFYGSKIIFQIAHGGCACDPQAIGQRARGPSGFLPETQEMTIQEIEEVIESYGKATKRLVDIGADGIMIHIAHGYGLSQFLSPYANKRTDKYGGESIFNRIRMIQEIAREVRRVAPDNFSIIAKINGHDCVPGGVTPILCAKAVQLLKSEGIQLFEISCGFLNARTMSRPEKEFPLKVRCDEEMWNKQYKERFVGTLEGFNYSEGYNVPYAKTVRQLNPEVPLSVVGGLRKFSYMEDLVNEKHCEMVSLGRPLIRDAKLVERFYNNKLDTAECKSCNQCFLHDAKSGAAECHFPK